MKVKEEKEKRGIRGGIDLASVPIVLVTLLGADSSRVSARSCRAAASLPPVTAVARGVESRAKTAKTAKAVPRIA